MDKSSLFWGKKTPEEQPSTPNYPYDPLHQEGKTVGKSGAILDLGRMLEFLLKQEQIFENLPRRLRDGLRKVYRMTQNAFKYAASSETEVLEPEVDRRDDPHTVMDRLNDTISDALQAEELSQAVRNALLTARRVIRNNMRTPPEPAPSEQKSEEKSKPVQETNPREQLDDQKRDKQIGRYQETQNAKSREDAAVEQLKKMFGNSTHYVNVFRALPIEIRKELQKISMDPENIKYLFSERTASSSRSVVQRYLNS